MVSLITTNKAMELVARNVRARRLQRDLTQGGLANRADVSIATLKKFERTGRISLESFLKLEMALGNLELIVDATKPKEHEFSSIDEVLNTDAEPKRKRGTRK